MTSGWLIGVDFLVMFFSSKDDTLADTPDTRRPFLQLYLLAQQLRRLGPPLGRSIQAAYVSAKTSL